MLSLIEQIRHGQIWTFPGGIHPPENKIQSTQSAIADAKIADEFVIPLKQHIGRSGDLLVKVGDSVLKGQKLTQFTASFMLPVHAPTSGTITAIEPRTMAHPSGLSEQSIVLKPDGLDKWIDRQSIDNYQNTPVEDLIEVIRQAGISGMGGAGFPTARKMQSGIAKTDILIINAAECEPYITADDMLIREQAEQIVEGIKIANHILKAKLVVVAIEDNKPEAIKALEKAAQNIDIVIRAIPTKYPSGGEKQLIKILTNREVPKGGIPADIGVLVQNIGSIFAIKRAVVDGEPLIERVVTLTGATFPTPQNVWVRIGTPVSALLKQFGYKAEKRDPRVIMGGPMMGFTLPTVDVPITKTSNCILAPKRKEIAPTTHPVECIRCGQCAEACPASLLPQQLYWYAKDNDHDKCQQLNIADCIECGACAYVCPSEIPLVQYYRQAKAEIRITKEESKASERAKARFEQKQQRLERDKQARENRFKKAASSRRKEMSSSSEGDAVAAAIARVKAQAANKDDKPAVKPAVAAAIARAKAKQAEAAQAGSATPDNSEMAKLREERKKEARAKKAQREGDTQRESEAPQSSTSDSSSTTKKDAVAAAIARAKAKKAQLAQQEPQQAAPSEPVTEQASDIDATAESDKKKAAVAAAIARAKAKKAQLAQQEPQQAAPSEPATEQASNTDATAESDKKKAAVAAAIARAKAKKAQLAQQEPQQAAPSEPATEQASDTDATAANDKKKAAVAAAVARAKAKKAQLAQQEPQQATPNEPAIEQVSDTDAAAANDKKKAAVAAAVARAKAKKAQLAQQESQQTAPSEPATEQASDTDATAESDKKKAAVAAAVARAKAKKAQLAQQEPQQATPSEPATEQASDTDAAAANDKKKAAVAAAIARAKAKKAEKEMQQNSKEND
ncbi:electron transport complex subunit RsxC [Vibrio sp. 99-8-1]|uniref:electron transport complex subunit RsxC n=1 Tax=Vibrio sp. 99-8-1 TaxID=2607602 RepID=UPI001493376C|nr:electron transport complex subunit RsxC [Vibrio sp. 99-8-1]NOI68481.1 electron transport complex subunit RsxC [Vibrio sp. 99-8-1]